MKLAVVGLGKLGCPLAVLQAQTHQVIGIDLNQDTVDKINAGVSPIIEMGVPELLSKAIKRGNLQASTDFEAVKDADISLVIVPTPSKEDGTFASKYVLQAVAAIGTALQDTESYHVVVICSTVMPGECDNLFRPQLEKSSGKKVGPFEDLGLVYSPEFIALGSVIHDMQHPAVAIVGQSDTKAGGTYANLIPDDTPTRFMSLASAEIAKIALNSYVTGKISFANTLGEICENVPGADANDVASAIGLDPRVGTAYIRPGGPFGGPCFPRDSRAFSAFASSVGVAAPLALATDRVNRHQIARTLGHMDRVGRKRVGILGFTYKPGTPIYEESFGLNLAKQCIALGMDVMVYDPMIKVKPDDAPEEIQWCITPEPMFGNKITTVICTPDENFQSIFPDIFANEVRMNSIVIDCWGLLPDTPWSETHVIKLGVGSAT